MNDLSSILIVIIALAVGLTAYLWRKLSLTEDELKEQHGALETQRKGAEEARATAKGKTSEIEELRRKLQDTKAKLKRKSKDNAKGSPEKTQVAADEFGPQGSAASVVHVGTKEVEARYEAKLDKLAKERDRAQEQVKKLKAQEAKYKAEKTAAKMAIAAGAADNEASPEAQVAAMKDELAKLRKQASADKQKAEKAKSKTEGRERASTRRANANHAQYLVIKGQLELAEDKLASFRTRYEGAKPPQTFKPEPKVEEPKVEKPKAEAKAEAPKTEAKAEAPKTEAKAEEPKVEAKAEEPKVEAEEPKAEAAAESATEVAEDAAAAAVADEANEVGSAAKA